MIVLIVLLANFEQPVNHSPLARDLQVFFSCYLLTFRYAEKLILKEGILFICFRVTIEERYLSLVNVFTSLHKALTF